MPSLEEPKPLLTLAQIGITGSKTARVEQCEQRTADWFASRVGLVTASKAECIVTPTGEPRKNSTAKYQDYLGDLVAETITRAPTEGFLTPAMEWGNAHEYDARKWYELVQDCDVKEVGFVYGDESKRTGCSPDGLVCPGRMVEIKCPQARQQIRTLLDDGVPSKNVVQAQFQLWIVGVPSLDFVSFWPGHELRSGVWHVEPDDKMHAAFREHVPAFIEELDAAVDKVRA